MSIIVLSQDERIKFANWLEQDLESSKLLIKQMKSLGVPGEVVAKKMRAEMLAELTILTKLRSIEEIEIG